MAMRDFWASWYALSFPRGDGRVIDLCGSVLCLTTAVDYVGLLDDAGGGGHDAYLAAASEGLACLSGKAATQALRDIVLASALIAAKDAVIAAPKNTTALSSFVHAAGGPVTPGELMRARWWDGAVGPCCRLIMSTSPYQHLTDDLGTFRAADRCGKIQRAIYNCVRGNEVVDLVSDYRREEFLNEACIAVALGGGRAILGLGDACARATDDALTCDCGEDGHEEAAEFSMGIYLWQLVVPRYVIRQQLACFSAAPDPIKSAYAWRPPGTRLRAVASTVLQPGDTLHSPAWQPLWTQTDDSGNPFEPEAPWAADLARRVVTRSLQDRTANQCDTHHCQAAATSILADCDRRNDPASLRALAEGWCRLFDTILDTSGPDSTAHQQATTTLRPLVTRIWQQCIVGHDDQPTALADRADERLYLDFDHAIRRTYALPPAQGLIIRRAFLGVVTSAAELSGLNPFARLSDGAARLLSNPHQNLGG